MARSNQLTSDPRPAQAGIPPSVVRASWFMYAGAVLSAIDLIVSVATAGSEKSALHRAYPKLTASQLHADTVSSIVFLVVIQLIAIGLWVVIARTSLAGRGWARIAGSVLFLLNSLNAAEYLVHPTALAGLLLIAPVWLAGLGAIILLWAQDSTQYFRSARPG